MSRQKILETSTTAITPSTTTQIPLEFNSSDEGVLSVLPALIGSTTKSRVQPFLSEASTDASTFQDPTTFDEILQHQYKIKGLDKDYEDEKFENHQEENEKLIGVLGSQVSSKQ